MDRESWAIGAAWIAGLATAAGIAYAMFGEGGGLGLPKGRYPVVFLIAIVVGPPIIGGAIAGFVAYGLTLLLLKPVETAAANRRESTHQSGVAALKSMIANAPDGDERAYVARTVLPAIKKLGVTYYDQFYGEANPEKYTLFHMAAAAKKPALVEALAQLGPKSMHSAGSGKHFDEIGTEMQRREMREAFARGYVAFLAEQLPQQDRRLSEKERQAAVEGVVEHIEKQHSNRHLSFDINPTAYIGIIRRMVAEETVDAGDAAAALPLLDSADRLLAGHASHGKLFLVRGRAHRMLKDNAKAAADFDAAIRYDAKSAEAHYRRARAREDLGRIGDALDDYDKAIALEPNYALAYIDRGAVMANHQRHPHFAIADFRKALEIDPTQDVARRNIEAVLKDNGADDASIAAATAAIEANPNDADALTRRGAAYRISGAPQKAAADIEAALAVNPDHVLAHTERYRMRRDSREWAGALADTEALVRLLPGDAWPIACTGYCLENLQRRDEALARYKQALAIKPDEAMAKGGVARLAR